MGEREGRVEGGKTSDEMVFEGSDGTFSFVGAMNVWGGELNSDVGTMEGGDEVRWDFVIKNVEGRKKATESEEGMEIRHDT